MGTINTHNLLITTNILVRKEANINFICLLLLLLIPKKLKEIRNKVRNKRTNQNN